MGSIVRHRLGVFRSTEFTEENLGQLGEETIEWLKLVHTPIEGLPVFDFSPGASLVIQWAPKLTELGDISIRALHLEDCPSLRTNGVSQVKGLQHFKILRCKNCSGDFRFLENSPDLRSLEISALNADALDHLEVPELGSLVWASLEVTDVVLRELSELWPEAVLSNVRRKIRSGREVDLQEYLEAKRQTDTQKTPPGYTKNGVLPDI